MHPAAVILVALAQFQGETSLQMQGIYAGTHDVLRMHWKELPAPCEL